MIVIADSGPLRYLIVIDQIHLLPLLYGSIVIPPSVVSELTQIAAPHSVRIWMDHLPEWVTVKSPQKSVSVFPSVLGLGEREAMALVEELAADILLVDDDAARFEAHGERSLHEARSAFWTLQPSTVYWSICQMLFRD